MALHAGPFRNDPGMMSMGMHGMPFGQMGMMGMGRPMMGHPMMGNGPMMHPMGMPGPMGPMGMQVSCPVTGGACAVEQLSSQRLNGTLHVKASHNVQWSWEALHEHASGLACLTRVQGLTLKGHVHSDHTLKWRFQLGRKSYSKVLYSCHLQDSVSVHETCTSPDCTRALSFAGRAPHDGQVFRARHGWTHGWPHARPIGPRRSSHAPNDAEHVQQHVSAHPLPCHALSQPTQCLSCFSLHVPGRWCAHLRT